MALHIEEFATMGAAANGAVVPVAGEAIAKQTRSLTTTSAQSSATQSRTSFVRLAADVACYYEIGSDPTAGTGSTLLPAGVVEYRAIRGGHKVAARSVS